MELGCEILLNIRMWNTYDRRCSGQTLSSSSVLRRNCWNIPYPFFKFRIDVGRSLKMEVAAYDNLPTLSVKKATRWTFSALQSARVLRRNTYNIKETNHNVGKFKTIEKLHWILTLVFWLDSFVEKLQQQNYIKYLPYFANHWITNHLSTAVI